MTHLSWTRVAVSAIAAVLIARIAVASLSLPLSLEALVAQADVIVAGRVTAIAAGVDPAVDGIYTYVTIQPTENFKGWTAGEPLVVKQLGGVMEERGVYVPGQPRFSVGEDVLLFLKARGRDATLFTMGLWQGKWTVEFDAVTAQRTAVKREPESLTMTARRTLAEIRLEAARLGVADQRSFGITAWPAETPRQSKPFVLNNPPIRWQKAQVPVNVEPGSEPGLPSGGLPEILAATNQWNAAGSSLTLVPGARLPQRCQSSAGTDILVTFADPCNEISSDPSTLAVAAFGFNPGAPQTINGTTFFAITDVVITTSTNPAAQRFLDVSSCFQSTMAHEIGHGIGLDHTPDTTALMYFSETGACFSGPIPLAADDLAGLFTIYPTGAAPPMPPAPPAGPPGQPTVTSANVTGGTLNVGWTPGSGGAPTAHRLDFFAGVAQVASVNVGAATVVGLPIPPGTMGSFTVQVTAFIGTASSPPSPPFPFMIGAPPGPGCTAPPAAPMPGGSIVAGTATVTWPAVPGATSYIISAGSTQGASNVSPPSNVGALTTVQASGLPAGFSAWVRVIATNACGQSAPGDFFLSSSGGTPSPPPGGSASIQFQGSQAACACWTSPIRVEVDGQTLGSLACSGSAGPFPVSAGAHTYRLCDAVGCVSSNTNIAVNGSLTVTLTCNP